MFTYVIDLGLPVFDLEWNKKWNLYLLLVVSLIYLVAYFSMMTGCVSISYQHEVSLSFAS